MRKRMRREWLDVYRKRCEERKKELEELIRIANMIDKEHWIQNGVLDNLNHRLRVEMARIGKLSE